MARRARTCSDWMTKSWQAMDSGGRDHSGGRRPSGDDDDTISIDIAEWLRGLGLEQYAPAFRDNHVDGEVLRRLTAEDLRELGVASIGHRRRLLDAIAALGEGGPSTEASPAPIPALATASAAARRQLTVMFCDLVGSTPLSMVYSG